MKALERAIRRALEVGELDHKDIAAACGCSREHVSRIAGRVKREAKAKKSVEGQQ